MNAAEKARLAREAQEKEKAVFKANLFGNIMKIVLIIILAISVVAIGAIVILAEMQMYDTVSMLHGPFIGVFVLALLGTVVGFWAMFKNTQKNEKGEGKFDIFVYGCMGVAFIMLIMVMGWAGLDGSFEGFELFK